MGGKLGTFSNSNNYKTQLDYIYIYKQELDG